MASRWPGGPGVFKRVPLKSIIATPASLWEALLSLVIVQAALLPVAQAQVSHEQLGVSCLVLGSRQERSRQFIVQHGAAQWVRPLTWFAFFSGAGTFILMLYLFSLNLPWVFDISTEHTSTDGV